MDKVHSIPKKERLTQWYARNKRWVALVVCVIAYMAVCLTLFGAPPTRYITSCIALAIISITMLARANDQRNRPGMKWQMRLVGFVMAGCAPIGVAYYEWMYAVYPSWYEVSFRVGVMLVFMTTPYMKPWWNYIKGDADHEH